MSGRREWSQKVAQAHGRLMKHRSDWGSYITGAVVTPHGIVDVYSQGLDENQFSSSSYHVVIDGRLHSMSENVARTKRGLAIVASRWARELAGDHEW